MPKLVFTRGLPGSGKSTYAQEWVAQDPKNRLEINRDQIRAMLGFPPAGDMAQEDKVSEIAHMICKSAFSDGKDVIISDTNLRIRYVKKIIDICMDSTSYYEYCFVDFPVDINDLIKRDKDRGDKSVGEENLRILHQKFPVKNWLSINQVVDQVKQKRAEKYRDMGTPYRNDPSNPKAIIVDIDGTIADHDGIRGHFEYEKVLLDKPHQDIISIVNAYYDMGITVIVVSGRNSSCLEDSKKWLEDNGVCYHEIYFRATGDQRPDWQIKDQIIRENIQDRYHVLFCLDDRNQVVEHNRKMGYRVLQVAPGDF